MAHDILVNSWIQGYPELGFDEQNSKIICSVCHIQLNVRKSIVDTHIKSQRHQINCGNIEPESTFIQDFTLFLICCNIPWFRVNQPQFRSFFNKYLQPQYKLPEESVLRKKYLGMLFQETLTDIRQVTHNKKLWICIDETLDGVGRSVANVIVQPLSAMASSKPYLIACRVMTVVNAKEVARLVTESLKLLWKDNFEINLPNLLMMCTDSAAYMLAAGKILKKTFRNLKHFTCLAHALHRVAEEIRNENNSVNLLISNMKKILLKSPKRKQLFNAKTGLPLPPECVITRWGTWLTTAFYYADNLEKILGFVKILNSKEAKSILLVKKILKNTSLKTDLKVIKQTYDFLPEVIEKLESCHISVVESLLILDQVRLNVSWLAPETIKNKLENVIDRIPDYDFIRDRSEKSDLNDAYKFATLTSVEVERSFSSYKWILDMKRSRLTVENMEKLMIIYYYNVKEDKNLICTSEDFENIIPGCSTEK